MSNVIGVIYNSDQFHWNSQYKDFTADISEVPAVLRQLWNYSMDLGFGIKSKKTGRVVYFTLTNVEKDGEGDVFLWKFEPVEKSVSANPDLVGVKVLIFND